MHVPSSSKTPSPILIYICLLLGILSPSSKDRCGSLLFLAPITFSSLTLVSPAACQAFSSTCIYQHPLSTLQKASSANPKPNSLFFRLNQHFSDNTFCSLTLHLRNFTGLLTSPSLPCLARTCILHVINALHVQSLNMY